MKTFLLLICTVLAVGCAQTVLYRDGKPIARFQGDMTGTEYRLEENGAVTWKSSTVDHSSATLAQGEAAANKISAAGAAIAVSGIPNILK